MHESETNWRTPWLIESKRDKYPNVEKIAETDKDSWGLNGNYDMIIKKAMTQNTREAKYKSIEKTRSIYTGLKIEREPMKIPRQSVN